jgi:hypothetical protein
MSVAVSIDACIGSLVEPRDLDQYPAVHCGFVCANAGSSPVRGRHGIDCRGAIFVDTADEFVYKVWVRSTMATTLQEGLV